METWPIFTHDRVTRYHKYRQYIRWFLNRRWVKDISNSEKEVFTAFCSVSAYIDDCLDLKKEQYQDIIEIMKYRLNNNFEYKQGYFGDIEDQMKLIVTYLINIGRLNDFRFWIEKEIQKKCASNNDTKVDIFIKHRYADGLCFMRAIWCLFEKKYEYIFTTYNHHVGLFNILDTVFDFQWDVSKWVIKINNSFKNYIILIGIILQKWSKTVKIHNKQSFIETLLTIGYLWMANLWNHKYS